MFMRTKRLFLRPIWPEDWAEMADAMADDAVDRDVAVVPRPIPLGDARALVAAQRDPRLPQFLVTAPADADGPRVIGGVGLKREAGDVVMSGWIARRHRGVGYATEALSGLLQIASTLRHRRLIARHHLDNGASARVLRKLGFGPTGERGESFDRTRGAIVPVRTLAIELAMHDPLMPGDGDGRRRGGFGGASLWAA